MVGFFFQGRRRHTRCSGDWSSDVCSSDLFTRLSGSLGVRAVIGGGNVNKTGEGVIAHGPPVVHGPLATAALRSGNEDGLLCLHVVSGSPSRLHQRLGGKRSEEHTSELQSRLHLVCRLLLEKKKQS